MPEFKCKEIGIDCEFAAEAKTEDELIEKIKEHYKKIHNRERIPPQIYQLVLTYTQ